MLQGLTCACTRVVLADPHPIFLSGLESRLRREPDLQIVARCTTGEETLVAMARHRPDILILNVHLPRKDGLIVLRELQRKELSTRVVLIADELGEEQTLEALCLGVRGMLLKELAQRMVVPCVRTVLAGEPWLEHHAASRALEVLLRRESGLREHHVHRARNVNSRATLAPYALARRPA